MRRRAFLKALTAAIAAPIASAAAVKKTPAVVDEVVLMETYSEIPKYGRGPGMDALKDAVRLREIEHQIELGRRVLNPPISFEGFVRSLDSEAARKITELASQENLMLKSALRG